MTKIAIYSIHDFEKPYLIAANQQRYELVFINEALNAGSAVLAKGCNGIAVFTSDDVSADVLKELKEEDVSFVVTRSAGYDHIDLPIAQKLGIRIANVPEYSPHAIAEHTVAMMLALDRHLIRSDNKVKHNDFSISDLVGFNLHNKTVGIIGTGRIGAVVCKILFGFGCRLLAYDIEQNEMLISKYGLQYVPLDQLCRESEIISLHTPLNEQTTYIINEEKINLMKDGVMLINTSRGKLINTIEVLAALKSGKIRYLGMDVYEKEKSVFFYDYSQTGINDPILNELIGMDNVLITAHHAFLTKEALKNIADVTLDNINCFSLQQVNPRQLND